MFRNFNYLLYKGELIVKNCKTYYKVPNYDYVYRGTFSYRLFLFTDRSFRFVNFFGKEYLQSEWLVINLQRNYFEKRRHEKMKRKTVLKRTLACCLAVILMLTGVPLASFSGIDPANFKDFFGFEASAATWENLTYKVSNGEATITGCDNSISGDIVIPNTLGGYPVTSIGDYAFHGSDLTSITIPDSVTSIGNYAFEYCTGLTSITIPDSVTSIGDRAFGHCTGLTSITIPDSVTIIGFCAFEYCTGLTSITIPNSVTIIGGGAFYDTAYYNNNSNWEDGVLYIGSNLIEAKNSISGAYDVKDGTKTIADHAFYGSTGLTSITIPDSVTSIGGYAFEHCTGLTSVTIPDSVTSIGYLAFSDCTDLTKITVSSGNTVYHSTDNCLIRTKTKTLICGFKNSIIPSDGSVTSIGGYAFSSCTGLTSVTIPDSVTSISAGAFYDCTGLTSIKIPNSVTSIDSFVFYGCTGLKSITIPDSVTSIGDSAFSGCTGLTSITIPNSVTSIGDHAFYGCTGLTSITIPDSVKSIGDWAFRYCTGLKTVYYAGTKEQWESIDIGIWNDHLKYANIIFNSSGSGKYDGEVTINVYSNDSYDGLNKLPSVNIGTKLQNFTVTTSSGSQTVTDASSVKIDIAEAKRGDVKISKNYYQDYIIPSEVFENIFNDSFYASLSVEMSHLPSTKTGYISTAFAKEDGEEYSSYTDTVASSIKVTKGNKYKVILKGAGLGSNVKYYLSQNGVHKMESITGVFEGDLFSQFIPHNDIYAYAVSSKGTTPLIKLNMEVVPAVQNKKLDDFLKSNSTNILGDAPTSLTGQTGNLFLEGAEFDLSAFKIPLSIGIEGNTVKVAIGIDGALSYSHETKDSSTTGTKWKKDGEWSNFVKDYKEYFEKDHSWATKKEKAKEANNKAKELTKKYGKKTSVKSKSKDFSLDVVGYGIWEIVWNGDQMNLVFKEGSAAVTGSLSYEYCQNGFVGACPGYMYFGFGASLTASAKNSRSVADSSVPMQWEFSITLEPEVTAGAGVGWKNWASLGLYGKASAPIYLRPALINRTGNFKIDVKGEIGVEATALFVFKTKKPLLDGTLNVINKTWTKTKSLKAPAMNAPYNFTSEAKTEAPKMAKEVESTDRSYAFETSRWLGTKSVLNSKAYSKAKALNLSGMKFTTLQESVFYAPQTQVALVGDKVLMTFVEDDTTRTANNRMRLMYTLYDPATDSWSQPKPVSDNGRNDSYPYLVSNGNNTYITWIKSNTLYPDDLSNTVDVFKACEVYLAQFDAETEDFTNVTRVTDDTVYDYSPSVAIDSSGNPVVYYASCTDNDTFGKNNTITKYTGTKTVLASGKYYILSMTANSDATELTYVMDKNGDTIDSTGVNAYTIKSAETTEINHETAISDVFYANLNGEEKLFFSDRTNIYYLDSNGEETAVLNSSTGISSAVYHIETDDGLTFIFTKKDGEVSELFSVSQTDNGWTEPVQISNEEKLIENIAVASNGNKLYGCITTKENEQTDLVGFSFNNFTDISLGDISISELGTNAGENNKFTVSVFNNGTNKIGSLDFTVSDTLGTNSEQTVEVNIEPGEMKIVELIYPAPENYSTTTLTVSADVLLDNNTEDNTVTKEIGLPELRLEQPVVEENADHYIITTYAENVSDIPAKNVSVSVKEDENNLIESIQYDELGLLQKEEISLILPKSCVTYDEDGFARVTISAVCGEDSAEVIAVLTDNSKNANGECSHIETELKETAATCETEGKMESVCVSCGEVLGTVAVLEKSEHIIVIDASVASTCITAGKTEGQHCSVCGKALVEQEEIPALSHDLVIDVEAKEATCTQSGTTEGVHCTRCDYKVEAVELKPLGHSDEDNDGNCDRCGERIGNPAPSDPSQNCSCACHKKGIANFFFKIILFFQKIFKKNRVCNCGVWHY